ncbi:hypothetical protein [Fibrobacter sp. UBA4297]|uniref:hypothetical protein n=1 Tax=Fibrobacter sp. UBA4297 TaxID=1946536 RepID=UPI0025C6CC01|nr:hypothetical protein [Fibrobacter sp. UBA4297]
MKFVLIAFSLFVLGCVCDNPRGCPAVIGVVNNPDEMQLRKEGRDDQSAQMAKLPAPPSNSRTPEPVDVNVRNLNEPIPVDDKLDFDKVK